MNARTLLRSGACGKRRRRSVGLLDNVSRLPVLGDPFMGIRPSPEPEQRLVRTIVANNPHLKS